MSNDSVSSGRSISGRCTSWYLYLATYKKPSPGCWPDKGKENNLMLVRQRPAMDLAEDHTLRE